MNNETNVIPAQVQQLDGAALGGEINTSYDDQPVRAVKRLYKCPKCISTWLPSVDPPNAALASPPVPTTATHWSHTDDPEQWLDNPSPSALVAADQFLIDSDDAWDNLNGLISEGRTQITLHGYRETTDPLPDEHQFDGYEPGQSYFAPTGETIVVDVWRDMRIVSQPNVELARPAEDQAGTGQEPVAGSAAKRLVGQPELRETQS